MKKEINIKCECSCSIVNVSKFEGESEIYLNFYTSYNPKSSMPHRIKEAWKVLLGGYNNKFEVAVSQDNFNKLVKFNE